MKQLLLLFVASLLICLNSMAQAVRQMSFLEGNPIWVYKYEHIPTPKDQFMKCWVDVSDRCYSYYFLAGQKEINNKVYAMIGEVQCDREGEINDVQRSWCSILEGCQSSIDGIVCRRKRDGIGC